MGRVLALNVVELSWDRTARWRVEAGADSVAPQLPPARADLHNTEAVPRHRRALR